MRISDWSSDVCSSDLFGLGLRLRKGLDRLIDFILALEAFGNGCVPCIVSEFRALDQCRELSPEFVRRGTQSQPSIGRGNHTIGTEQRMPIALGTRHQQIGKHTSELQSLMRTSYAVFCL